MKPKVYIETSIPSYLTARPSNDIRAMANQSVNSRTTRTHGGLIMWQDPIVKETRELRNQYAEKFNHDLDAIFEDIKRRQEKSNRRRVSFSPRKAVIMKQCA